MQKMRAPETLIHNIHDFDHVARFAGAQLREHGLHFTSIDMVRKVARFAPEPVARPLATKKPLVSIPERAGDGIVRQEAERLAAREQASLVSVDTAHNMVELSPTIPAVDEQVRRKIAKRLKTEPHNVDVAVRWSEHDRIETITVHTDAVHEDPDRASQEWKFIVNEMPGGSNGWRIRDDRQKEETLLTWGPVRALPPIVPLMSILPAQYDRANWRCIPLGRDSFGNPVNWMPGEIPHTLISGPTGAGKSIQLSTLLASWAAHGGRYVVIDAVRQAADFVAMKEGASAWAVTLADAAEVLEELYAEGQRRMALWLAEGETKWSDLTPEVIAAENIWPILVVIDEYVSLVTPEQEQKELEKNDPLLVASMTNNRHRATIRAMVDKIARELRPAGIHLAIATQRPDVTKDGLSGSTRDQLSNKIQLQAPGRTLSSGALGMTMQGDDMQAAQDEFRALDDGSSKGLAAISAEGVVSGYRVAFAKVKEIPELLASIGVPLTPPPVLFGSAAQAKWAPKQEAPQPVAAPTPATAPELFPELLIDAESASPAPAEDEWF